MKTIKYETLEGKQMYKDFFDDTWQIFRNCCKNKSLYIWGCGNRGKQMISNIIKYSSDWIIDGFIDNDVNKQGKRIANIEVFNPKILMKLNPEMYLVLICNDYPCNISKQLNQLGVKYYFSEFWMNNNMKFKYNHNDINIEKTTLVRNMLCDDLSKKILDAIIWKRQNDFGDYSDLSSENEYFRDEFWHPNEQECFIDGGAYTGDTIDEFVLWTRNKFRRIYSFEPDINNYNQIMKKSFLYDERITIINAGLGEERTQRQFVPDKVDGDGGRVINRPQSQNDSDNYVDVVSLDDVVTEKVTLLKLDVEGYEGKALLGAKKIIKRDRPNMIISIYHKPEDLWELPIMIKQIIPEYKFSIRHTGRAIFGTNLYIYL